MRPIAFLNMILVLALHGALSAAETQTYYLTKHQWNHLMGASLDKSKAALKDKEVKLEESASQIGSRLTEVGLKVEKVKLVNRWEMEVTAPEKELERLSKVLEFFDQEIYVYIKSRVFDMPAEGLAQLETLGMEAKLEPALFPINSAQEYEKLLRQINSTTTMDLLSAPTVIARSGESAKIDVGSDFIYPSDYDPPKFPDGSTVDTNPSEGDEPAKGKLVETFPVTPASPNSFETRRTGIVIEFLPILELDGTVNLQIKAENVRFEGFINYGSPIMTKAKGGLFKQKDIEVTLTENRMEFPVFTSTSYQGRVDIAHKKYFILGGLQQSQQQVVEDKKLFGKKTSTEWFHRPTFFVVTASLVHKDGSEVETKDLAMLKD